MSGLWLFCTIVTICKIKIIHSFKSTLALRARGKKYLSFPSSGMSMEAAGKLNKVWKAGGG
jgi:hypothetical protein